MARNDKKQPINEMKGTDRLFRLDRDTLIVFTGHGKGEVKPFLRVGAGEHIPYWIAPHIEHIIFPDQDIWNLGTEIDWFLNSRENGLGDLEYVGSREKTQIFARYAAGSLPAPGKKAGDENKNAVHIRNYDPNRGSEKLNDRALITFLNNGSFLVQVDGGKVMDYEKEQRVSLTVDKEYEAIGRSLSKRSKKLEKGYGFVFLGSDQDTALPIYWSFQGNGLFMNPSRDHHYSFFENRLDPDKINMAIAGSAASAGFVELFRRKEKTHTPISVFTPESERVSLLKKLFGHVPVSTFDDSRSLTFAKECIFFASRSRSHGIFSMKLEEKAINTVQILFPLEGATKINRSFDFTRGPHDLEIRKIQSKDDLLTFDDARLTLYAPEGKEGHEALLKGKVSGEAYPLVPGCEYGIQYYEDPVEMVNYLISTLVGTGFDEDVRNLVSVIEAESLDLDRLRDISIQIRGKSLPEDPLHLSNLYHAVKFVSSLPGFTKKGMVDAVKSYERILARVTPDRITATSWLELQEREIQFQICFFKGKKTAIVGLESKGEEIIVHLPPAVHEMEVARDEYKKYLKQANKVLDKLAQPPQGLRMALDFCEKLFEFRIRFYNERVRLLSVLEQLELFHEVEKSGVAAFMDRISPDLSVRTEELMKRPVMPAGMKNAFGELRELVMPLYLRMGKYGKPVLWSVLGVLLIGILSLFVIGSGSNSDASPVQSPEPATSPVEGAPGGENESGSDPSPAEEGGPTGQPGKEDTRSETGSKEARISSAIDQDSPVFASGEGPVPEEFQGSRATGIIQKLEPPIPAGMESSLHGNSGQEKLVTALVNPGKVQRESYVPGESEVIAYPAEVLQYAEALASSNGFDKLHSVSGNQNLRDPDLLFPGETLTLPDGRLVPIEGGETIWNIATVHYKKDFARVTILLKQLRSESGESEKKNLS